MTGYEMSILYRLYRRIKVWLNYLLDRMIDLCDMFLMDAYRFPWPAVQNIAQGIARYVGDVSWLLRDFPRLSAYHLIGADWTIIFVGRDIGLREICHLFFEEEVDRQELGRIASWQLSAQTEQWLAGGVDLVICELSRIYPNRPKAPIAFTVPTWINQILTIPNPLETLIAGRRPKGIRRRIGRTQKAGFAYRFSRSKADFDHFYYQMYLPFIKKRHGDLALITPYEDQRQRWFIRGGLVLVTQSGKPVAGTLCYVANDTCFSIEGGILDADPLLFQQGINAFLIWCAITWAHDLGVKVFNMGGARPWRCDGSFAFKQAWGARVTRPKTLYGEWTFLAHNLSPSLQNHLNKLGPIGEIDGKFRAVLLNTDTVPITKAEIDKELSAVKKQGLEGLVVISANSKPAVYELAT